MSIGRNSTSAAEIAKAFDGSELKRQASDRCDEIAVKLLGNPTQADRREMRWGSHGSRVLDLGRKRGLWYDHENGTGGDMIALVRDVLGCDFSAAVDWLHSELSLPRPERRKWSVTPAATLDEAERIDRARACYFAAKPALERQAILRKPWLGLPVSGRTATSLRPCLAERISRTAAISADAAAQSGRR